MDEILVSKTTDESLYFRLKPKNPELDGRVERGDSSFDVPFWSYVTRSEVNPITTTTFHKNLWNGSPNDKEWLNRFWYHTEPFTKEELDSLKDVSKYTGAAVEPKKPATQPKASKPEEQTVGGNKTDGQRTKTARVNLTERRNETYVDVPPTFNLKRASNPSPSAIDNAVSLIPGGPDVVRGATGGRGGNLATLLRWWRPRMMMEGGFRRCLVTLADHPELYPLENICAWLHHETTGLWPNEGCHHPGMKNCRNAARRLVHGKPIRHGSILSDSEFARRVEKLKPKKKSAEEQGTPVSNEINFKALAFLTATGTKMRVKSGLWSSNSRVSRAVESGISYVAPGDMSRVRKPIRSTAYRAITPGGGGHRDRIGHPQIFRCPPGFTHGGSYTDRRFSTCGPKLFEAPGQTDTVVDATRRAVGATTEIARGMISDALNADKPLTGRAVTAGNYGVPVAIQRAAEVAPVGAENVKKVMDAIAVNASLVYEDRGAAGKLIRRDGSVMNLTVPIEKIASLKNVDDMKNGYLISRVTDPMKMGDAEMPTLASDLKGFVLSLPGGNHIRISKTDKAKQAAMKGINRRFNMLRDSEKPFEFGSALTQAVADSRGALSMEMHMPGIEDPNKPVQIERDGAIRSVLRWVFELFLSDTAPARNKQTKPWKLSLNR